MTTCAIRRLKRTSHLDNLTDLDRQALTSVTNQHQSTIKRSDKGGNIVVMNSDQYRTMCMKILSNKDWYKLIPRLLIEKFDKEFYSLVDSAYLYNTINKQTWDYIRASHSSISTFYSLPKIHKDKEHPPGRPIVSGRGGLTENLSRFIDGLLRPMVTNLLHSGYIASIGKSRGSFHPIDTLLVTVDVEALYSSIPHQQGIAVIRHFLSQTHTDDKKIK